MHGGLSHRIFTAKCSAICGTVLTEPIQRFAHSSQLVSSQILGQETAVLGFGVLVGTQMLHQLVDREILVVQLNLYDLRRSDDFFTVIAIDNLGARLYAGDASPKIFIDVVEFPILTVVI